MLIFVTSFLKLDCLLVYRVSFSLASTMFTISRYGKKLLEIVVDERCLQVLAFSFLFFAKVFGPFEFAGVSSEFQRALFTFA
jgi:hypothetical protein